MTQERPGRELVTLFAKALRRLGDAGQPQEASRLAAQAWWTLKDEDPRAAEHVNGVMHYLARLEAAQDVAEGSAASDRLPATPAADAPPRDAR